jgi:spore maturation protein CgeB
MKILVVSDRHIDKSSTDFLVNTFSHKYNADIIYTKNEKEKFSILDRALFKLNIELDKSNINSKIIKQLSEKEYDVLLILKGNRIFPWTLKKIKKLYPKLSIVSWSGDNMSKWHNKSIFFHYGINYYDIILSVNIPDYRNIEKFCSQPIFYFDKRAERSLHKPLSSSRQNFKYDVLFIGSYEKERFKTLSYLAENGIKIDIFGNMWNNCKDNIHSNLKVHYKELVGKEYVDAIYSSKISLGFLRKINNDTQTSRTFEIPACGGFMLMERTDEHVKLFIESKEAEFFSNDDELLRKLKFYLKNEEVRELIAIEGRKRVESSGYFFDDLASEMIDIINKVRNENL